MKKARVLLLLALLLPCLLLPVSADSYTDSSGSAVFTGDALNSTFSSASLTASMSRLEPGDDITISIAVKNSANLDTNWYMTNSVLKSLEQSKSGANGGAYKYRLSYLAPDGSEEVFYDSANVGGELGNIVTATGSLNNYFFMGTLKPNQTGTVKLHVALDGETQGNNYQNTLAQLQMNFAVEKQTPDKNIIYYPKTGDVLYTVGWGAAFVLSAAAIVLLLRARRKLKKEGR